MEELKLVITSITIPSFTKNPGSVSEVTSDPPAVDKSCTVNPSFFLL